MKNLRWISMWFRDRGFDVWILIVWWFWILVIWWFWILVVWWFWILIVWWFRLILLFYFRLIKDVSSFNDFGFVDLIWVLILIDWVISSVFIFCFCCFFDIRFEMCLCELRNGFFGYIKWYFVFGLFDVEVS